LHPDGSVLNLVAVGTARGGSALNDKLTKFLGREIANQAARRDNRDAAAHTYSLNVRTLKGIQTMSPWRILTGRTGRRPSSRVAAIVVLDSLTATGK
jgi:hypothetical protein